MIWSQVLNVLGEKKIKQALGQVSYSGGISLYTFFKSSPEDLALACATAYTTRPRITSPATREYAKVSPAPRKTPESIGTDKAAREKAKEATPIKDATTR